MKTALITGASSGIGKEFVNLLAKKGNNLVLAARSKDLLESLAEETRSNYNVTVEVIGIDLSEVDASQNLYNQIKAKGIQIDILINNAGFGEHNLVVDSDVSCLTNMIDLNVRTLTALSTLYAIEMKERNDGEILNVASTAAFQPIPKMAVYAATKAYVLNFTEALHFELRKSNVSVTTLCPGATATGFEKTAHMIDNKLFKNNSMSPEVVAAAGYRGLMKNKMIVIPGFKNWLMAFIANALPSRKLTLFVSNNVT